MPTVTDSNISVISKVPNLEYGVHDVNLEGMILSNCYIDIGNTVKSIIYKYIYTYICDH